MHSSIHRSLSESPLHFVVAMLIVGGCALLATLALFASLPTISHLTTAVLGAILGPVLTAPVMWKLVVRPMREDLAREAGRFSTLLERRNRELAAGLAELGARELVQRRLSEMGELLQSSTTEGEAINVVASYCGELLRNGGGALFVRPVGEEDLVLHAAWGDMSGSAPPSLAADGCWAMRRGRMHVARDASARIDCAHSRPTDGATHFCLPLAAHGESLGVLHVAVREHADGTTPDQGREQLRYLQRLLGSIAEHTSLALANLRAREVLRSQSIRDPLTGLFNRRFLDEWIERELHRARRQGIPVSLLTLDLDHFKQVNDRFGHEGGDTVLRDIARILQEQVRAGDIACRVGGEEFAIVAPGSSPEDALALGERIRAHTAAHPFVVAGRPIARVSVSIGTATYPWQADDVTSLLRRADDALYQAKAAGRNCVCTAAAAPSSVACAARQNAESMSNVESIG